MHWFSMLFTGFLGIVLFVLAIALLLLLINVCLDIIRDMDSDFFGGFFLSKKDKARRDEYLTILEMKINREEALRRGDKYVADPALIHWHYHTIDKDGKIIKKY